MFEGKKPSCVEVSDATSCVANVDDYGQSTRLLAATTLRNVLGTRNLSEILSDREAIADSMHQTLVSRVAEMPTMFANHGP